MPTLMALAASFIAGYAPIALLGDSLSLTGELVSSTVCGVVAYAATLWYLKRLRDGL